MYPPLNLTTKATPYMQYPHMVIMRASPNGCIWQAYQVKNELEEKILKTNGERNGFVVTIEEDGYTEETYLNWRDTDEWKKCLTKYAT